jgi:hypothetical protein
MGGRYLATRGLLSFRVLRRRGVNLEAVRGAVPPQVWLVAHIDSKWQPVPMAARAAGIVVLAAAAVGAVILCLLRSREGWTPLLAATWIGAIPVMLSTVGEGGVGAVDNASGVAAVLTAAAITRADAPVGVLITDAEELGLAGARAWATGKAAGAALNCDGIDDDGTLTIMYSGRPPTRVLAALRASSSRASLPLRVMRVIPGILTDSVALAAAGWETATLSRGSLRTLRRIHTTGDDLRAMRGTSIAVAGHVLAGAAADLCNRHEFIERR